MIKKIVLSLLLVFIGFGLASLKDFFQKKEPPQASAIKWKLADAIPRNVHRCLSPTEDETELYILSVDLLQRSTKLKASLVSGGLRQFLSRGVFREIRENGKLKGIGVACPPPGLYKRLGDVITANNIFKLRMDEYDLDLALKIEQPSDYIVDAVAATAFSPYRQRPASQKTEDIRPYARTVLAGFGSRAAKYAEQAFDQISANDSLGTGAAQVAVSAGHPDALPKIAELMAGILSSVPTGKTVPFDKRDRLYELAYALRFGGEKARNHTASLKEFMKRKVQSWAPPFGVLEINPPQMCDVLAAIEGKTALAAYPYCRT